MSVELLYTSAPNGLKQGSRGFCTVLSTQGMPVNLASRLELLSGYRHIFPPQDAQANLNPVAWSHVSLTMAGQVTSILSRIAAYGVDYSGRTNKLAHHVVVGPSERIAAGPAWLLQSPGLMRSEWGGVCETPASGPPIVQANQSARVCETWKSLTGDAGWGGVVAEALVAPAGKPLWVIYRLDQQRSLLELMNESIALLPESQRWQATFSTYYTNLPPEVDCKVRFVVEGTEEASKLASRGSSILLSPGIPLASASAFVESARTGAAIAVPAPAAPATRPAAPTSRPAATIDIESMWDEPENTPLHRTSKVLPPSATLATSLPESPPAIATPPKFKGTVPPAISSRQHKGSKAKLAAMLGVPLILLASVATAWAIFSKSNEVELAKAKPWVEPLNEAPPNHVPPNGDDIGSVDAQTPPPNQLEKTKDRNPETNTGSEEQPSSVGQPQSPQSSASASPTPSASTHDTVPTAGDDPPNMPNDPDDPSARGNGEESVPAEVPTPNNKEDINEADTEETSAPPPTINVPVVFVITVDLKNISCKRSGVTFAVSGFENLSDEVKAIEGELVLDESDESWINVDAVDSSVSQPLGQYAASPSNYLFLSGRKQGKALNDVTIGISKKNDSVYLHLFADSKNNDKEAFTTQLNDSLRTLQSDWGAISDLTKQVFQSHENLKLIGTVRKDLKLASFDNAVTVKKLIEYSSYVVSLEKSWNDFVETKKRMLTGLYGKDENRITQELRPWSDHASRVRAVKERLTDCLKKASDLNGKSKMQIGTLALKSIDSDDEPNQVKLGLAVELRFDFPDAEKQEAN